MSSLNTPSETIYQRKRRRYPWWVKTVDALTIEWDPDCSQRPVLENTAALWYRYVNREDFEEFIKTFPDIGLKLHLGVDRMLSQWRKKWEAAKEGVIQQTPGHSQKDQALMYGAYSLYYDLISNLDEMTAKTAYVNITQKTGAPPWQGSKQEASDMMEKAARALGASQIGFTTVNRSYIYQNYDYPPEMKYVISIVTEWAPEGIKRADTVLAAMANRVQTFREQNAVWGLRNFIKGLGYKQDTLMAPWPAYGVLSGLGELSRANRLVSPIFGAAVNVYSIVTDLPLAVDKPIDFGLQEFCKRCKKCAKSCPVGCINFADEPSWEPKGVWNSPGKKVYYEKGPLCGEYLLKRDTSCSICLGVCPWTKQDSTVLHQFSKALSAKLPWAAKLMVFMDGLFGYGTTKDPKRMKEWWELDLPPFGMKTRRWH